MRTPEQLKKILDRREKKNAPLIHASLEMEVSTHFPVLLDIMKKSTGKIIELGGGLFSTPLLHWFNFESGREIITYESYKHYYDFEKMFETKDHKVIFVKDFKDIKVEEHYGLVFIDHSVPKRRHTRGDDALRFKDSADFIVLHDAGVNPNPKYGYTEIYPHFKYVYHWDKVYPHTTVCSNRFKFK